MRKIIIFLMLLLSSWIFAQESTNYKLKAHVFNEGGNPDGGIILTSANFKLSIDSNGEGILGMSLSSPLFKMDGGFIVAYPPPGEVHALLFDKDHITLKWNPEKSVGTYNLYRNLLSNLFGGGYGNCKEYGIENEQTTDTETPPTGYGYFYLVTAKNRIAEEGTMGYNSAGTERSNSNPCP